MFSLERDTAVSLGELVSTVCCGQLQQAETLEVPVTEETPQWFSIFLFGLADSWAHRHESHLSENPGLRFESQHGSQGCYPGRAHIRFFCVLDASIWDRLSDSLGLGPEL